MSCTGIEINSAATGTAVVERARHFGMKIIYYKRHRLNQEVEQRMGIQYAPYHDVLKTSDYVNLMVPHTQETDKMLGAKELAMMKPTAYFLNLARAVMTDEGALVEALREKRIAGAALDVFSEEPLPADHPLLQLPNVIALPHIGGNTAEVAVH